MTLKKYVIGVKHKNGAWCYAPNVTDHPIPLFTCNRSAAQEFVTPERAKCWFANVSNLFYEYDRKLPAYKWDTLCVKEIVESECVFSYIKGD